MLSEEFHFLEGEEGTWRKLVKGSRLTRFGSLFARAWKAEAETKEKEKESVTLLTLRYSVALQCWVTRCC